MMERIIKVTKLDNYYDSKGLDTTERIKQIASDLQISEEDVRNAMSVKKRFLRLSSLNDLVGEDYDTEIIDLVVDTESEEVDDKSSALRLEIFGEFFGYVVTEFKAGCGIRPVFFNHCRTSRALAPLEVILLG